MKAEVIPTAVLDGQRMPLHEARLPVTDAGVARGDGAFETIGVWDGAPFAVDAHLARLARSLALVGLPPVDLGLLRAEVLGLVAGLRRDAALRLYVTASGTRLITLDRPPERPRPVHLAPAHAPWIAPLGGGAPGGPKTMSYLPNMAASRAARAAGADDALLLSGAGEVLEGSTFALLWVTEDVLHAPDLALGIIDSISRRQLLDLAAGWDITIRVGSWPLAALAHASEILAVSSLRPVIAVRSVAGTVALSGPTPVGDLLAEALRALRRDR